MRAGRQLGLEIRVASSGYHLHSTTSSECWRQMGNAGCIQDKMGDLGLKRMMKEAVREESFVKVTLLCEESIPVL